MSRSIIIAGLLLVAAGFAHAEVNPTTQISLTANIMASSCVAAHDKVPVEKALQIAHSGVKGLSTERIEYFVLQGYAFSANYPGVSCNQVFITVIDTLVRGKV